MKKIFILAILALLAVTNANSQSLNLDINRIRHDDTRVYVDYSIKVDVTGVKLFVSYDNGATYTGPLKYVSGDIGDVDAGNRTITWNFMEEFGNLQGNYIKFKVTYDPDPFKSKWFVTANGAYNFNNGIPSFGLTFGHFKRHGWFVSLMSNFNFSGYGTKLECNNSGIINGSHPFFTGETTYNRISVTAGALLRVAKSCFIKVGAGYGVCQVNWRTMDGDWVKNTDKSATGIDVDAGLMFDIKGFSLSFDAVTTNFKKADVKIGIGWAF